MNGISVMTCVRTNQKGFSYVYGREDRMKQKYIKISRQNELQNDRKNEGGRESGAFSASESNSTFSAGDRHEGLETGRKKPVESGKTVSRKTVRSSRSSSGRSGKSSSGRRGTSFVLRTLVLAVIFAGMLAGFQMMTRASSREKEQTYKYYTTVTIGYGEDLSDIVYQYCDSSEYESADAYVREICDINSLPYHKGSVPDLKAGARIVIPYFSTVLK